jgi:hypothetical protein
LAPGETSLERARLCTPLHTYQSTQTLYLIESTVDSLGLSLPAQARVSHAYAGRLDDGPLVHTLEVRRHPVEGVKVTGERVNFVGCELLASEDLRRLLGFPIDLGEFGAPSRFDHGWVTFEFLIAP